MASHPPPEAVTVLAALKSAHATLQSIAQPTYGLGFNRLRGLARAELARYDRLADADASDPMPSARPALTDAQVEAMCRAHHEARHPAHEAPIGGFSRWATWEQVCEIPGELARRITAMRAALSALDRL